MAFNARIEVMGDGHGGRRTEDGTSVYVLLAGMTTRITFDSGQCRLVKITRLKPFGALLASVARVKMIWFLCASSTARCTLLVERRLFLHHLNTPLPQPPLPLLASPAIHASLDILPRPDHLHTARLVVVRQAWRQAEEDGRQAAFEDLACATQERLSAWPGP